MPDTTVTVTAGMPTTVTVTGGVIDVTIDVQRGIQGIQGIQGEGVPAGGSTHQVLRKINATDFNTEFATLGVADIGGAAPIASPSFTGNASVAGNLTVDTNTLFVDAASNKVGIGTTTPAEKLSVSGNISTTGTIELGNASDTTLSRSAAGKLAVEGVDVVLAAGTQTVAGAKTLSGQLELTGQSATTANSAMNRSLVDARSLVSLQGSNQTINNVATYTASNMTLSLGVGTWELNGLFYINAAATGGSKIYISVVSGAQPEAYQNRFTILRVQAGSSTPTLGHDAPAYGGGTFPFRLEKSLTNSAGSLYHLNSSLLVLTAATQIDIGFSQNTAAVGNLTLYSFSKFWAKRLTH